MRNLKILFDRLKELSWGEFLCLLRDTLFFDEPILVYAFDLSREGGLRHPHPIDGLSLAKGELGDLELARQTLKPLPWEFQCHEFDGVKDFFVARSDGGIQHISWLYFNCHRNRLLALGENEVEIKFCLTLPSVRGRGIYPNIILLIVNYLNSKGTERVFMCVHRDNRASIRGMEKADFIKVGETRLRKFMGIQISPRFKTMRVP